MHRSRNATKFNFIAFIPFCGFRIMDQRTVSSSSWKWINCKMISRVSKYVMSNGTFLMWFPTIVHYQKKDLNTVFANHYKGLIFTTLQATRAYEVACFVYKSRSVLVKVSCCMGQIGKSKQKQNGAKIQMCEKWKNSKIAKTENWKEKEINKIICLKVKNETFLVIFVWIGSARPSILFRV